MSKLKLDLDSVVARAKTEILNDVAAGHVPAAVSSFADLHDHVDANGYGGFFEDGVLDALEKEHGHADSEGEGWVDFANKVQDKLDAWIKSGELARAAKWTDAGHNRRRVDGPPPARKAKSAGRGVVEALIRGDEAAAAEALTPLLTAILARRLA